MTESDRITIEQRIIEKGKPENLEHFRQVHSQGVGEPISEVDISAYFNRLKAAGVDQWNAAKIAIDSAEIIDNETLPLAQRRRTAEAVCAAVRVLPKKLVAVPVTVYKRK